MKMKKIGLMLCGMLLMTASLYAQDRKRPSNEERAKMRAERIAEQLTLSEEQKAQVYDLQLKQAEISKKMRTERRKQMAEMRENHKAYQAEFNQILSPEQQEKWTSLQAERLAQRKRRFRQKPGMHKKPVQGSEVQNMSSKN